MTDTTTSTGTGKAERRADLDRRALLISLALTALGLALALLSGIAGPAEMRQPGVPLRQAAAILGTALLLVPFAFSVAKRGGLAKSPPAWFVAHVLSSAVGTVLIFAHAAGGDLLSPPALLLPALVFLVAQGVLARVYLSDGLATRFAAQTRSFLQADPALKEKLRQVIRRKTQLLGRLDPGASEALFSPNLRHGLRHPVLTFRYARLEREEARLVGSRRRAGPMLALWRRLHIAVAMLLLAGMLMHVLLATFFAGYVAEGGEVYWWHVTAWGAGW